MTMEKQAFEDVSPIKNIQKWWFSIAMLVFPRVDSSLAWWNKPPYASSDPLKDTSNLASQGKDVAQRLTTKNL